MDNATRRQILERVKQLGYPNTVEALQNPQVLDQYEQQLQTQSQQQQQQSIQQQQPVSFPTPPVTTPNYKVPQPTQSEAKPLVMSFNETAPQLMKTGGIKLVKGGPKDKGWQEFKTPTGQSLFLDPRFKNQRYYVDEKGNMSNPDQNLSLYDVKSGVWEAGTSMPTLEIKPRYRYEKRPGALGSFETVRIDDDNNTSEVISPNPMETRREQEKFVNSFNPAAMATEGLISMGQGNIGEGLTQLAFSSPLLPKVLSKTGRQELKQGFNQGVSNAVQPVQSRLGNKVKAFDYFLDEASGELIKGKANKEAIEQGNNWLKDWINHPNTQFKIDADLNGALPTKSTELIRAQSKNYTPNVQEFPLRKQLFKPMHNDNYGVSYTHSHSPEFRNVIQNKTTTPYPEYGEWMSRSPTIPQAKRVSTTIHEGTHGWVSDQALKESGMADQILSMYHPKTLERYKTWDKLRSEGKNPRDFMTDSEATMGYLANPTEVHARIMELRHQFGLSPDDVIQPGHAKEIMNMVNKNKTHISPDFLNVINHDPQKLSDLFNNLWTVTPAVGAGYLGSKLYQNQQQEKPVNKQFVSFKTGGKKCYTCNGSKMEVLYNKAKYKK